MASPYGTAVGRTAPGRGQRAIGTGRAPGGSGLGTRGRGLGTGMARQRAVQQYGNIAAGRRTNPHLGFGELAPAGHSMQHTTSGGPLSAAAQGISGTLLKRPRQNR